MIWGQLRTHLETKLERIFYSRINSIWIICLNIHLKKDTIERRKFLSSLGVQFSSVVSHFALEKGEPINVTQNLELTEEMIEKLVCICKNAF